MSILKALLDCARTHRSDTYKGTDKRDFLDDLKDFIFFELSEGLENHQPDIFDDHNFTPELEMLILEAKKLIKSNYFENYKR